MYRQVTTRAQANFVWIGLVDAPDPHEVRLGGGGVIDGWSGWLPVPFSADERNV
jgi:hypothetical protein